MLRGIADRGRLLGREGLISKIMAAMLLSNAGGIGAYQCGFRGQYGMSVA